MKSAPPLPHKRKGPSLPAGEAVDVEQIKNEFISTVSHELRTPLTSIRGALVLVMSGAAGELPDKAKQLLSVALRNSERLIHIVNDILDAEKIESGKMRINMEVIALAQFLQQALACNELYAEKFNVRFRLEEISPDAEIMADSDRLIQVITNLLSNAAKFSQPRSEVIVRAYKSGKKVIIEIQDFGPGIPEEFQPHIFEKFAQAPNKDAPHSKGTGLGLNLSRQMVELMRGEIGFRTETGNGTTFFICFPSIETSSRPEVA